MSDPSAGSQNPRKLPSLVRGIFSNWVGLASAVLYTLVITPIVIGALEREAYGIWSFLNALVAYSGLFYLGLGSALVKYVAQHYATGNRQALNRLVSVVFTIYTGLGLGVVAVGAVMAPFLPGLLLDEGSHLSSATVSATVILLAVRLGLIFVGGVFSGVLMAQGRIDLHNAVAVAGHLLRLVLVPIAVRTSNPLLTLAMVVAVTGALEVTASMLVAFSRDRALRFWLVRPRASELRLLYGFGLMAFVLQIAERLISYTDTTVIGLALGMEAVAMYAPPLQLIEYGRIVVVGIVSVMLPHLTAWLATGGEDRVQAAYRRILKTTALVTVFINASLIALGPDFLRLWVGPEFSEHALPVLVALGVASVAQGVAVQSQTPFCLALGQVRFPAAILIVEGVVNLVLSVILAPILGIAGVALATAIPAIVVSGTFLPVYVSRLVGTPLGEIARSVGIPTVLFAAVIISVYGLLTFLPGTSYALLAAKLSIVTTAALLTIWFVVTDTERRLVRVAVARGMRRLHRIGQGT
jgi:O-antigen/teichoic acid export membrane protein